LARMRDALNSIYHEGDALSPSKRHKGHEEKTQEAFFVYSPALAPGASVVSFVFKKIFTPENIWAFILFLIVIALIIFTTDSSPVWIYQGF